ncbi:Beta-lactamase superfamily domain [Rhizoctonia solani]|uniref:Beta-lactamase superfamily domain n=1 Tax=Rhizoctonia solani TaxID=456999 RepID=A0A8H7IIA2_9AGAM|nr:Beta-lactamase superfamily domain [Rhizoctonia solani]
MSIFSARAQSCNNDPEKVHIEIYGTPGLRQLIRSTLNLTHMNLSGKYIVHELHNSEGDIGDESAPHPNEIIGSNIRADSQQFWQNIGEDAGIKVDVGPIEHRVACMGYVFTEKHTSATIPRRLVCLGDTSSATHIAPLCVSEGIYPSLVIHESTNAWIPPDVDRRQLYGGARKTPQSVREKAISKGHSTPDMAGPSLARFPNPSPSDPIMREIARQATVAWGRRDASAIAAHDLFWIDIPQRPVEPSGSPEKQPSTSSSGIVCETHLWDDPLEPDQPTSQISKRKWAQNHTEGSRGSHGNLSRGRGRGREEAAVAVTVVETDAVYNLTVQQRTDHAFGSPQLCSTSLHLIV